MHIVLQVIDFYYRFLLDIGYTGFFRYRLGVEFYSTLGYLGMAMFGIAG